MVDSNGRNQPPYCKAGLPSDKTARNLLNFRYTKEKLCTVTLSEARPDDISGYSCSDHQDATPLLLSRILFQFTFHTQVIGKGT